MRESGRILATILELLKTRAEPGLSTKELANYATEELHKLGGEPTFLNYQGFPDVLCTSINNEVVHGIPSTKKIIRDGDIVSLDFGVTYQGMITDSAISLIAGKARAEDRELLSVTERSMYAGIDTLRDGVRTGDIGNAVETVLNEHKYGVVRDLVGHGVGHHLHEDPNIPNYGHKGTGTALHSGATIAIEPMANLGSYKVFIADDGWTILTQDGSRSAHFEHTVLITEEGSEILTTLS
jgi:methionyl aminopeptidase